MEGAARLVVHTLAFECDVVAHNIYDIGSSIYSIYGFTINHRAKIAKIIRISEFEGVIFCIATCWRVAD